MHAKQYIALARAIKHHKTDQIVNNGCVVYITPYAIMEAESFTMSLCDILAADNPRFSKEKFMEAVK